MYGGFNGGGNSGKREGAGGGGATDIRNSGNTLDDRILVAGAGGGGTMCNSNGCNNVGYGGNGGTPNGQMSPSLPCLGYTAPKGGTQFTGAAVVVLELVAVVVMVTLEA